MKSKPAGLFESQSLGSPALRSKAFLQLLLILFIGSLASVGMAFGLVGAELPALTLSFVGYLAAGFLAIGLFRRGYPHPSIGLCNLTTLTRMAMIAALLAPLAGDSNPWALVVIATIALVMDGVDGYLARKQGRVSEFGARLDMEVDSVFALILVINLWIAGIAGPLILLLGLPRYIFVVAAKFLPWLNQSLPPRYSGKVVCVIQVAGLIGMNAPIFPSLLILPVSLAIAGALVWSFGRDIIVMWKTRH